MDIEVYLDDIWTTRLGEPIQVSKMTRAHVRNSLQWCILREGRTILGTEWDDHDWARTVKDKDGLYYRDWIAIFTARLLSPDLAE